MKDEFNDLKEIYEYAWRLISKGTVDKKSPARYPTFGTIGLFGMPELRTVVLRDANQKTSSIEVHTDVESKKVEELKEYLHGTLQLAFNILIQPKNHCLMFHGEGGILIHLMNLN